LLVLVANGCDGSSGKPPYEIKIDLAPWIADLGSDDVFTSEAAVERLIGLGEASLPPLRKALENEGPAVRAGVVEALKQLDSPAAVPLLLVAANDSDAAVRAEALLGLGEVGDERGRAVVEAALDDEDRLIALAAADACASLCRTPASLQRLIEMALYAPPFVTMAVPRQSLRYMANQEDERASATREAVRATALPLLGRGASVEVRTRAALLLTDVGDAGGIPWLNRVVVQPLKLLNPHLRQQIRLQAISAVGAAGNAGSVAALRRAHTSFGPPLKEPVCRALRQLAQRGVDGAASEAAHCKQGAPSD
jgi:HEAT repeat protein